jgi:hypothetical protein
MKLIKKTLAILFAFFLGFELPFGVFYNIKISKNKIEAERKFDLPTDSLFSTVPATSSKDSISGTQIRRNIKYKH